MDRFNIPELITRENMTNSIQKQENPTEYEQYGQVSSTIWEQLGGHRFGVMTGVKNYFSEAIERGAISFFLPRRLAKNGIIHVRIVLTWRDTYDVTFSKKGKEQLETVEKCEDIYADNLQECFTRATGLATHL